MKPVIGRHFGTSVDGKVETIGGCKLHGPGAGSKGNEGELWLLGEGGGVVKKKKKKKKAQSPRSTNQID